MVDYVTLCALCKLWSTCMMRTAGQIWFYSQVSASQGSISSSSLGARDPISVDFCLHSVCKCGKERWVMLMIILTMITMTKIIMAVMMTIMRMIMIVITMKIIMTKIFITLMTMIMIVAGRHNSHSEMLMFWHWFWHAFQPPLLDHIYNWLWTGHLAWSYLQLILHYVQAK